MPGPLVTCTRWPVPAHPLPTLRTREGTPVFADIEPVVGLFPGQGAYRPRHLARAWRDGDASVRAVFDAVDLAAEEVLGRRVTPVIFADDPPGPEELLAQDPGVLQVAVFGLSAATHRFLSDQGVRFSALAGHSMGELTALVCAGAFTLADGARVLCHRIAALREHDGSGGGMVALPCEEGRARRIMEVTGAQGLAVAVSNGPGQTVVSGPHAGIGTVAAVAAALGLNTVELRSPHPFHNPVLAEAQQAFARAARDYGSYPLRIPVYSPILQRWYRDTDDLAALLALHLVTPLEFGTAVDRLHRQGARVFVELGAGGALGRLVERQHPDSIVLQPLDPRNEYRALSDTVAYLNGGRPAAPTAARRLAPAPAPAPAPALPRPQPMAAIESVEPLGPLRSEPSVAETFPSRTEVFSRIRALYAEVLEYPEDVLTEDAELEAELGIDSVKQVELLGRVRELFHLDDEGRAPGFDQSDTLGKVVEHVRERLAAAGAPV